MTTNKLFDETDIALDMDQSDFNELKNRSLMKFGYPIMSVPEITDPVFSFIVKDALNQLSTWCPKIVDYVINLTPYQSDYVIEDYNKIGAILDYGVTQDFLIMIGLPIQSLSSMGFMMALGASNDATKITDWISLMALHNTAKNVWQVMPHCELIHPNIIRVVPLPQMNTKLLVRFTCNHSSNLGSLNKWEKNFLIRWCECQCGKFIGNVRRKYEGAALPVGSLSNSGGTIYTESLELENQLMEELKQYKKYGQIYIDIG